jgi:DNA mismatch endonuclease (patch repair protein)
MVDPARSANMAKIKSKNTQPELIVRRALHRLGFRYSLHDRTLPGHPDIVLTRMRTVIQVRGCFWHLHSCPSGRFPASRQDYWVPKLTRNHVRDLQNDRRLRRLGWSVHTIWECQLARWDAVALERTLLNRLRNKR